MSMNARLGILIAVMLGLNLATLTNQSLNNAASGIIGAVGGGGTLYSTTISDAAMATSALANQEAMVGDLKGEVAALSGDVDTLNGTVSGLNGTIETMEARAMAQSSESERLSGELETASAVAGEMTEKLDASMAQSGALDSEIAMLSAENADLKKPAMVKLAGETVTVTEAVLATSKRISQRTAESVTRSIESMTAKSIPFVGLDAVVGSVNVDVDRSCETLKDLNALLMAVLPDGAGDVNAATVCDTVVPTRDDLWSQIKENPGAAWDSAVAVLPEVELSDFDLPVVWEWAISKF